MADTIRLEIVTPERRVVSEDAQIVMAPGSEGEFGVLDGHTPFLTSLKVGMARFKDTAGNECGVFINGGFAEALADRVTILAESAERRRDIDLNRAQSAMERAENRLAGNRSSIDETRAKAALARALHRIHAVESR
ncbi:F0F1 ATP synthase subunit epsilon [Desulfoluna spongiiphila]|uniref:ATP synthase epsilon chain n=1 Tax=Desulfoluna spongiiphila TaxID=419481 RepID=A0A1G5ITV3_9BACT|nr:F0F1 ATP synthase subunit epsilon [Desulfoluna spongiiphila]SCY79476.1 ATP synthase F1 subcomplex epsilon subunit [Desulfoluna spongiiphila]VVS93377.1 atp synthase f1 complex delta/epsilon subunit [Desulfoluna spongiiphila]